MFLAGLLFTGANVIIKSLPGIPVAQLVFMRSIVIIAIVSVVLKRTGRPMFGNNKKLLILRGLFGSIGIAFFFYTLQTMPLASAVTIHNLTPIFTTLIAVLITKDHIRPIQWFFFAMCFAGVLMIKGFDTRIDTLSLIIGIISTIAAASAYNVISYLKNSEHYHVIMFYFPLVTLPLVTIYILITGDWVWGNAIQWIGLVGVGILTYAAQHYLTRAYQDGVVDKISILSYLGVAYSLVIGFFGFDEWYSFKAILGLLLVMLGVVLNVFFKRKAS